MSHATAFNDAMGVIEIMNNTLKLTVVQPRETVVSSSQRPFMFTGSGANYFEAALPSLIQFLKEPEPEETEFKTALLLSHLLDVQQGRRPLDSVAPWAQTLYRRWSKNMGGEDKLPPLKQTLPTILPSVCYTKSFKEVQSEYPALIRATPRSAIRINASFWKHTGVFGLDIDLKDMAAEEAEAAMQRAREALPKIPGYLFGYVSPSGGIKGYLQVDEETLIHLNTSEGETTESIANRRQCRHAAIFAHLSRMIKDKIGLSLDPCTSDISRLQFLYHGQLIERNPDTPERYQVPGLKSLMKEADQQTAEPTAEDDYLTGGEPIPDLIQGFPVWLDKMGYEKEAEGFRALRWDGNALRGECPRCRDHASTERGPRDLQLKIDRNFPSRSWFHCLHSHCQDPKYGIKSMQTLFKTYLQDLENNNLPLTLSPVTEESGLLKKVYYPDQELMEVLRQRGPLEGADSYIITNSDKWPDLDFPCRNEKNAVMLNSINIEYLFKQLRIRVVKDLANNTKAVLDLGRGKLYPLDDDFINHLALHWNRKINGGMQKMTSTQHEIGAILRSLSTSQFYHPLASVLRCRPWDGVDRVSQYIKTLELDESKAPKGWEPAGWLDFVMRTWLYTIINHMENAMENAQAICPSFCPILIGGQGCGKSAWAARLLNKFPGCFTGNFDIRNEKDALVQKSSTLVIQLDEIDRYLSNPDEASHVKNALDITPAKTRAAYQRDQTNYQPKAVFIGTSNDPNPLTDVSGNRRYSVLYVQAVEGNLAKARAIRDSINLQQLWSQVQEEYHALECHIEERVDTVVELSQEINLNQGMRESSEAILTNKIRPVDWIEDTDTKGKPLWKRIPENFRGPRVLLQILQTIQKNKGIICYEPDPSIRPGQQAVTGFKQALSVTFGPEYAMPKQAVEGTNARRMRVMLVEDWLEWASSETKERWYNKFPEWRERDEQTKETML